jgi:hypothetical protein
MQPGASRQRQRIVADVPMAAARRSTGGAVPRKDEPTAITSSKRHPVGSILLSWSHPHQSTVPANPCAPREAGTILPKDPAASYRERPRWWRRHVVAHSSRSPGGVRRDRTRAEIYDRFRQLSDLPLQVARLGPIPNRNSNGTQHVPGGYLPSQGEGRQKPNGNEYSWALWALLVELDHCVREGVGPPGVLIHD